MRKINQYLLILVAVLSLAACSYVPLTQEEIDSADYGKSISQNRAKLLATSFLEEHLVDASVQSPEYRWGELRQGWIQRHHVFGHSEGVIFGYVLDVDVTYEKNTLNRYWMCKPYTFVFRDGEIEAAYRYNSCVGKRIY